MDNIGSSFNEGKPQWGLVDFGSIEEMIKVLDFGARKYGVDNWKGFNDEDGFNRLYSATIRHLFAWKNGETNDEESGHNHLAHAICNLIFLLYFNIINKEQRTFVNCKGYEG